MTSGTSSEPLLDADRIAVIDFGGTKIEVGIGTADGAMLVSELRAVDPSVDARTTVRLAADHLRTLIDRWGVVSGVSAVTPGIVRSTRIDLAPNVPGWESLGLADLLRESFPEHAVSVGNDVRAAALAESRWGVLADASVGMMLNLGTGVSAAVVDRGRLIAGANDAAGEIGYLPGDRADAPTLEQSVGGLGLGRFARTNGVASSVEELFRLAREGDPDAARLLERALDRLALAVTGCCLLVDPARVVITGGMSRDAETVIPFLTAALEAALPYPPSVQVSRFGHRAPLFGALAQVVHERVQPGEREG